MIPLTNRRIALVGGAGFIGHNLALALAGHGADVAVIDSLAVNNLLSFASAECRSGNRELYLRILRERLSLLEHAGVQLYIQDARDEHALAALLRRVDPQVLVHLAGVSHAQQSNRDPHGTFQHILCTLENCLNAARDRVEHFLFFSSSMVYGNFVHGMVTEDSPCDPLGVYGALKYAGEKMLIAFHQVFGLPYTIVRPSALYGERCVSRRVAQVFIENALRRQPLTVAGDGSDHLDFTYIDDLVAGVLSAIRTEEARNQIFNLTYGCARTVNDVIALMGEHFPDLQVRHEPRDWLMPNRGTLCIDKARALLSYEPRYSIELGLAKYVQWYRAFAADQPSRKQPLRVEAVLAA